MPKIFNFKLGVATTDIRKLCSKINEECGCCTVVCTADFFNELVSHPNIYSAYLTFKGDDNSITINGIKFIVSDVPKNIVTTGHILPISIINDNTQEI